MGEIILVRHGQANSAAKTEHDYDQLSPLGWDQTRLLGDWLRAHDYGFDHVLSGTLRRHRETAESMGVEAEEDGRLNEIEYYRLSESLLERKGEPLPTNETFVDHMPKVLAAWKRAEIEGNETFEAFEDRIRTLLAEAAVPGRRVLCVTSGGVIGMVMRQILELDLMKLGKVMLPIWNSSMHRLHVRPNETVLAGYNAIPHLEGPRHAASRTHV